MVSNHERLYLMELLSALQESDLFSLSSTTTGGKLSPKNKQDAIDCILLHSDSAETILKRKKVTKDILFNYLHAKKIGVLVSDEKPRLIQYILQLWNGDKNLPQQGIADNRDNKAEITNITYNTMINIMPQQIGPAIGPSEQRSDSVLLSHCSSNTALDNNRTSMVEFDEETLNTLAFKFTEWFYSLLNKNFKGGGIAINSEHFWGDAEFIFRIKLSSCVNKFDNPHNNVIEEEHVSGMEEIIMLLNKIKDRHHIYFSPNLSADGVKGKSDRHGGVLILACGTLHKDVGQMCGIFEQVFLIFRDPLTKDNWKIKKTEMHLISVDSNTQGELALPTINNTYSLTL